VDHSRYGLENKKFVKRPYVGCVGICNDTGTGYED
jgi:hypothetical protein